VLSTNELLKLACQVWSEFLGITALPDAASTVLNGDVMTGVARFEAGGGVALTLSKPYAFELAAKVFMVPPDEVMPQETEDLVGDLATIFANSASAHVHSNVRPGEAQILASSPSDSSLCDDSLGLVSVVLDSQGEPVLIRLFRG